MRFKTASCCSFLFVRLLAGRAGFVWVLCGCRHGWFRMAFHVGLVEFWKTAGKNSNCANRTSNIVYLTARGRSMVRSLRICWLDYLRAISHGCDR